jgi:hypothetical protein
MSTELKWYVVRYVPFQETPQVPRYLFLRAYSWQDAFDSLRKDRLKNHTWSLYPIEINGTFYDGNQFVRIPTIELAQASWSPNPQFKD